MKQKVNWAKGLNGHIYQEDVEIENAYEDICNIIWHYRNSNWDNSKIPFPTY